MQEHNHCNGRRSEGTNLKIGPIHGRNLVAKMQWAMGNGSPNLCGMITLKQTDTESCNNNYFTKSPSLSSSTPKSQDADTADL
jgi:hypothetical protein